MEKRISDRRTADRNVVFPLCDSLGVYVAGDRRSGLDRRKATTDQIAFDILGSITT